MRPNPEPPLARLWARIREATWPVEARHVPSPLAFAARLETWAVVASVGLLLSCLAGQLGLLQLPIVAYHQWRGAATYSVAYNYVHESWNFFLPRTDWRNQVVAGVTTMEMPGYAYVCALAMRLFGDAPIVCRSVNFLTQILALGAWGYFAYRLRRPLLVAGLFCAWAIMPAVAIEFRQIQPDPFLVSWAAMAAAFFYLHGELGGRRYYAAGLVAFTLACASKPMAIPMAPAMVLFASGGRWLPGRRMLRLGLPLAAPVAMALAWHCWSLYLCDHVYGLSVFEIRLTRYTARINLKNPANWQGFFTQWIPGQLGGQVGWPLMLLGMARSLSRRHRRLSLGFWTWFAGSLLGIAVTAHHVSANLYYLNPLIPPCAYFIALGIEAPLRVACETLRRRPEAAGWGTRWAVGCILVLWVVRWLAGQAEVHTDLLAGADFWFHGAGPTLLAAMFAGGAAVAEVLPRSAGAWKVSGVLACLALASMATEARASAAMRANWLARQGRGITTWSMIHELRATVDRYSTREDPIMVVGLEPTYLHWPLRKGWAVETETLEGKVLPATAERGQTIALAPTPRLLIWYQHLGPIPPVLEGLTPLAECERWTMFCTDPKGCVPR